MDPNSDSSNPTPTPEAEAPKNDAPAPDVSMSLNDAPATAPAADAASTTVSATATVNPGHTLGLISLIVSILGAGIIGIILGALGLKKSKAAGQKNGLAVAGIIIGVLSTIVLTIIIIVASLGAAALVNKCAELGNGTHVEGGVTYTCNV